MTLAELDVVIVDEFNYLVTITIDSTHRFASARQWLIENMGRDACDSINSRDWSFCSADRWTECAEMEINNRTFGFRFRLALDAVLFKLSCG